MVKVHFENIHAEIINCLESAQTQIKVCVAWFTDYEIYKKIVDKQKEGIHCEIIVANHEFNKKSKVDFKDLLNNNGKACYIGKLDGGSMDKLMHNKFCIIDDHTVITGSYNWSLKARRNDENILIVEKEPEVIKSFTEKFGSLNPNYGFTLKNNKVTLLPIEKIMAKWDKSPNLPLSHKNEILDKF